MPIAEGVTERIETLHSCAMTAFGRNAKRRERSRSGLRLDTNPLAAGRPCHA
jgi:hypothetical protein